MWIGCIQLPLTTILTVVILSIATKADGSNSEACHYVYTRQPPSHLSCTPHRSLVLLCEAHSTWQAFRLLWYAVPPHADSPIQLPNPLTNNITVKMMPVAGHSHHVISTLSLPLPLHYHDLRQIYCQIELHNGSLLQPSQIMVLPLAKLELCTQKSLLAAEGGSKCAYYFMPPGHRRAAKQLEPQRSTIPTEMLARPPAALYAIVAIIVLFVIVIISLTIIVVLLYRKKCVQMEISSPGPRGGTNTYDGFDMDRPTSSEHTLQEGSEPSFTSKRPLSAQSPSPHHSQPALSQADFALHPGPPACPPKHHLTASISANPSPALNVSVDEQVLHNHKRPKPKLKFKVLESSLGNYECSPTYQSSSAVTFATPTLGKYSGDYERDPNYMRRLRPLSQQVLKEEERRSNVQSGQDTCVDIECGERTEEIVHILCNSKYRGNYERSPIYMEKLLQSGEVPSCHQEYTTLATTAKHSPRPYTETFAHPHSSEAMSEHPFQPSEAITDQSDS